MTTEIDRDSRAASTARVAAAKWSARLHSGNFNALERAELARWRRLHPENEKEFQAIERLGDLAAALPHSHVQELYGADIPERPDRRRRRVLRAGLALACVAGAAAGVGFMIGPQGQVGYATELLTLKGERRTVNLPDGSVLEINTDTAAKVALYADTRFVELLHGEIMFSVQADPDRPFIVDAGWGKVRVTGTRFSVRRETARVSVVVESGSVEVSSGPWWHRDTRGLTAGQATAFDERGASATADNIDVAAATAWRNGRLIFRNAPLSEVINEMNRYLVQPIRLEGARIQGLRVTASFLLDDPDVLVSALRQVVPVQVRRSEEGGLVVVPR